MNTDRLSKHARAFVKKAKESPEKLEKARSERNEHSRVYQAWTADRLEPITEEGLYEYISPLWAMRMWGNKHHVVDKVIADNGLAAVGANLSELLWSQEPIAQRWDRFRTNVKGIGPAMMSELLCKTHPQSCALWNRRAYIALDYLGVEDLPRHSYQVTGAAYERICSICQEIADELREAGYARRRLAGR